MINTIRILSAHKKRIVVSTFTVAVLTAALTFVIPKTYTATAKILPPQQDQGVFGMMMAQVGGLASLAGDVLGNGTSGDTCVGFLQSDTISDRIIDRFALAKVYETDTRADARRALEEHVSIQLGKKDGLVSVSVEDRSPARAAAIANAYIEELSSLTAAVSSSGASSERAFMQRRLEETRRKLQGAEEALKAFQQRNGVIKPDSQMEASIQTLAMLKAQLTDAEVKLAMARKTFRDSEPEVREAKAAVSKLQAQIDSRQNSKGGGAIPNFGGAPEVGQEYIRLMREFKTQEAVFEALTKQFEISQVSETKDFAKIQVVQKATVPDKKTGPRRASITLAAFFATFFISSLWFVMKARFQRLPGEKRDEIVELAASLRRW
ncbi:lipopolysaccharide biosynthesis protein [Geomonas oryzisoli]|uniref:Lipopolysaccharide biosynthesis protein n=1 Tax=Geomonas oryzisoli TaxID=2847992 RepID=A0ABX8JB26_9BACT|nr:Wzz/FepE/Etk N-terminal domain-containing protein [Geomonas oryzisoli]QWV94799.1 lipopolysaccharide biosynthesis protein [Geomonas oryzisoli]